LSATNRWARRDSKEPARGAEVEAEADAEAEVDVEEEDTDAEMMADETVAAYVPCPAAPTRARGLMMGTMGDAGATAGCGGGDREDVAADEPETGAEGVLATGAGGEAATRIGESGGDVDVEAAEAGDVVEVAVKSRRRGAGASGEEKRLSSLSSSSSVSPMRRTAVAAAGLEVAAAAAGAGTGEVADVEVVWGLVLMGLSWVSSSSRGLTG
jgi:hypothetical protein